MRNSSPIQRLPAFRYTSLIQFAGSDDEVTDLDIAALRAMAVELVAGVSNLFRLLFLPARVTDGTVTICHRISYRNLNS